MQSAAALRAHWLAVVVRSEQELQNYTESPGWGLKTELRSVTLAYDGLSNSQLVALLGKIRTVDGSILIESCTGLTEIVLAELTTVGGLLEVLPPPGCSCGVRCPGYSAPFNDTRLRLLRGCSSAGTSRWMAAEPAS